MHLDRILALFGSLTQLGLSLCVCPPVPSASVRPSMHASIHAPASRPTAVPSSPLGVQTATHYHHTSHKRGEREAAAPLLHLSHCSPPRFSPRLLHATMGRGGGDGGGGIRPQGPLKAPGSGGDKFEHRELPCGHDLLTPLEMKIGPLRCDGNKLLSVTLRGV